MKYVSLSDSKVLLLRGTADMKCTYFKTLRLIKYQADTYINMILYQVSYLLTGSY